MSAYRTHRHARGEQTRTDNGTDLAFRIAAFGAIRRAAEFARRADEDNSFTAIVCAAEIRRAIRAAIGSDKT